MQELQKLYKELIHEKTKKVDVLASLAATKFIAEDNKNYMVIQDGKIIPSEYSDYVFQNIEDRKIPLTQHALQQLCNKSGVPMAYLMKCDPELRQHNMNYWMQKSIENNLLRCVIDNGSSRVRGILSDKYTPVDDSFIVKNLIQAIESSNLKNPMITRMYTGDEMLRIQVTDGKMAVVGDTTLSFYSGNSEIGLSKVYIEGGLYTFSCTNGLRIPNFVAEFTRRHIGNINGNMIQNSFQTQIEGIINNYSHIMQYMNLANQIRIKRNSFDSYIENSKALTVAFKDSMKNRIKSLPADNILWNYISEMTHEAQNYKEIERMEIEKQAGLYMDSIIQKETKKGKYELAIA